MVEDPLDHDSPSENPPGNSLSSRLSHVFFSYRHVFFEMLVDFPNTLARHDVEGETNERGDATILVVDPWRLFECHEPRQAQIGN